MKIGIIGVGGMVVVLVGKWIVKYDVMFFGCDFNKMVVMVVCFGIKFGIVVGVVVFGEVVVLVICW